MIREEERDYGGNEYKDYERLREEEEERERQEEIAESIWEQILFNNELSWKEFELTPIFKSEDAKKPVGYKEIREALEEFEADVLSVEIGKWTESKYGKKSTQEYFDFELSNLKVLKTNMPLPETLPDPFNFRVNCSETVGSWWIEEFVKGCIEKLKITFPEDVQGKRATFKRAARAFEITRNKVKEKVVTSNFIITKISGIVKTDTKVEEKDLNLLALELLNGKTEAQFLMNARLNPLFTGTPVLESIKSGEFLARMVAEGKVKKEGDIVRRV